MYVRFVVGTNQDAARNQTGVIVELRLLKESGELPPYQIEQIDEIFAWINEHLPVPPFSEKNWSREAIAWFKDSAQEMISVFRDIVAILEEWGRPVRMLKTTRPGMILYEDEFQVVAQSKIY